MNELMATVWKFLINLFWTNGLTTVPIVVSIVAVFIAVATARKQNKIALFEKRYMVLSQLNAVLAIDAGIYDSTDCHVILSVFDAYFGTQISVTTGQDRLIATVSFLRKLRHDIFQASLLFRNRKITKHVEEILLVFARVITDAAAEKLNPEDQTLLHKQCEDFYKKECNWLYKKTRL